MSAKKGGLGKGVNALFRDKETNTTLHGAVTELPLASVVPNSQQARRIFDEQALQELSESIRTYGIVQPLVVRAVGEGRYEIIAGERRWRAAKAAGLTQVPVVVRTYEDRVAAEVSLIENIQRENLNVVEEATAYKVLIDMNGWTQEELADWDLVLAMTADASATTHMMPPKERSCTPTNICTSWRPPSPSAPWTRASPAWYP